MRESAPGMMMILFPLFILSFRDSAAPPHMPYRAYMFREGALLTFRRCFLQV